jgi:hypothetical protein
MKPKNIKCLAIMVTVLVFFGLFAWGCTKQSAKQITEELANDMTDEMNFNNGQVKSGPPPAEHKAETGYPQSTIKSAPSTLLLGQNFAVQLKQTDTSISTGAVVFITPATKYITVAATVDSQGIMTLTGQLAYDAELTDVEAKITIAMQRSDGGIGNYSEWKLALRVADFDCTSYCSIASPCNPYMESCVPYCNVFYNYIQQGFLETTASCMPDVKTCEQLNACESSANQKCVRDAAADGAINTYCQANANCHQITVSQCISEWNSGIGEFSDCFNTDFWNLMTTCSENYRYDCANFDNNWENCMGWPKTNGQ